MVSAVSRRGPHHRPSAPGGTGGPRIVGALENAASPRAPRADVVRNRAALVDAAAKAFAEHGADASVEDVARRANVGIGTLYRHFPTRDALVLAAYRREVDVLCASADELLATTTADEALATWMQQFVDYVATKRGMASALETMIDAGSEPLVDARSDMVSAVGRLLAAAAKTGRVRGHVAPENLLRAMSGHCLATDGVGWKDQARLLVGLLRDGLRYGATH